MLIFWKLYPIIGFIFSVALFWRIKNECYYDRTWTTALKKELIIHPSHYIWMVFFWGFFPYTYLVFIEAEPASIRKYGSEREKWIRKHTPKRWESEPWVIKFDPHEWLTRGPEEERNRLNREFEASARKRVESFDKTVDVVERKSRTFAFLGLILAFLSGGAAKSNAQGKKKEEEKLSVTVAEMIQAAAKKKPLELGYSYMGLFYQKWVMELQMFNEPGVNTFELLAGKTIVNKEFFKLTPMPLVSVNDSGKVWWGINMRMIFKVKELKFSFPVLRHLFPINGGVGNTFMVWVTDYPYKSLRLGVTNIVFKEDHKEAVIRTGPSLSFSKNQWDFFLFPHVNLRNRIPGFQFQVSYNF